MTVLYVTGWCRSGSTLLGNLLDTLPGVVHVGELHYLWQNGILGSGTNSQCGCGQPVERCVLWDKVLSAMTGPDRARTARDAMIEQRTLRTRHTGRRLAEALGKRSCEPLARSAADRMILLHKVIAEVTDARLVVDSSKFPAEAAALCARSDVRVLHLVRDPRATAHSWRRAKDYIPAMGPARSTAYWTGFNVASERIGRAVPSAYLRVRYEDFVASPRSVLRSVLDHCGLPDDSPVDAGGRAELGVNHTVTGNPDRLRLGPVQVRSDDAWRTQSSRRDKVIATSLAAPLLHRYGYA